jgi:hypothetical protein
MNTGWWFLTFPCNVKFCTYKYMFMLDHHIPKTWKIQTTRVYIYIHTMASTWSTWFSLFAIVWCTSIAKYAAWRGLCPILKGGYLKVRFLYGWWTVTKEVIWHCLLHPIVEMKITCLHIIIRYSVYCAFKYI